MNTPLAFGVMPWEAVATFSGTAATLIAGAAAVIAAYRVGMQQAKISKLQADILDQQARTDESRFRAELFERRLQVYLTLRDTIHAAVNESKPLNMEVINKMFDRFDEARFIFSKPVFDFCAEVTTTLGDLLGYREVLSDAKKHNVSDVANETRSKIVETRKKLSEMQDSMHELFRDEMHMSHLATSHRKTSLHNASI